jgi:hypothetical protein
MRRFLSRRFPKSTIGVVSAVATTLAAARIVVLVCESYSVVRGERSADRELLSLCDSGTASMSADFRSLCLKKRSEQAAPVLLKALLRSCRIAFADFCESMSSPWKVGLLLLFTVSGLAAPLVRAVAALGE